MEKEYKLKISYYQRSCSWYGTQAELQSKGIFIKKKKILVIDTSRYHKNHLIFAEFNIYINNRKE